MNDIPAKLRDWAKHQCEAEYPSDLEIFPEDLRAAADEIEWLRAIVHALAEQERKGWKHE